MKKLSIFLFSFLLIFNSSVQYSENDLEIKTSLIPGAGKGVFAKKDFPSGAVLGVYSGKFITNDEHWELYRKDKWHYVMGLSDCALKNTNGYTAIDGQNGNIFTRINHAPEKFRNTKFIKLCESPYVQIATTKAIKKGEELYIDYGPNYVYDFMENQEVKDFFNK